jgi:hypothetical protein
VGQTVFKEGSVDLTAAFNQEARDGLSAQSFKQPRQGNLPAPPWRRPDLNARGQSGPTLLGR